MQPAKQQVVALIQDYQAAVYRAVALLNAKSERERGFQRHEESPGYRAGYLDEGKRVRYAFHGTGCLVTTPEVEVDFDYAGAGGCTGINPWFMVYFLKSNPAIKAKYPLLTSEEQVEEELQELVKAGWLAQYVHSPDDERYYLTANIHLPNQPTVTLYMPDEDASG